MGFFAGVGHLARLARGGFALAREGALGEIDPTIAPPLARPGLALARLLTRKGAAREGRLARAIARVGPSYVKLGQFLSTRPDIVGPGVVRELSQLQDRMAPFPRGEAAAIVEAAFRRPLGETFAEFSEPIAAASIAQVHRAVTIGPDGRRRDVAVKVLRPGVARRFRRDLGDMYFAARLAERRFAEARRLRLVEVVDTLARSVSMEMDFRIEAAAASAFAENVADDPDFRTPAVDWERTGGEVLTLDWVDAIPLSDPARLAASGLDLTALGRNVIRSFLRHALRDGFFHADMHQGNLFADSQGRLIAVDFGIMGTLGPKERRFLAEILFGFITRNYRRVAEVHFEAGYVPSTRSVEDFALAIRAIGEPIHARTADQISMARLLTLLFEITSLFDMRTRPELVMLQKTMVVVEGVARALDPRLDIWSTSEPVVREWIERNLGPAGRIEEAAGGLMKLARAAAGAPELLARVERLAARGEERERALPQAADADALAAGALRRERAVIWALWAIAALIAVGLFI